MASPNLDLVRSIYAAWEQGDYSVAEWAHPSIEFVFADGPNPGAWTGPDGMAQAMSDFLGAWDEFSQSADEYRELDAQRILVLVSWHGRGRASGIDLAQAGTRGASLFQIDGGSVTRLVAYLDRERAVTDLALNGEYTTRP